MSCGEIGYLEERLSPQFLLENFGFNAFDDKEHERDSQLNNIFRYTRERLGSFELNEINIVYESNHLIAAIGCGAQVICKAIRDQMED